MERGAALLATLFANSKSKHGGFRIVDFMPHEEELAIELEQAKDEWE